MKRTGFCCFFFFVGEFCFVFSPNSGSSLNEIYKGVIVTFTNKLNHEPERK